MKKIIAITIAIMMAMPSHPAHALRPMPYDVSAKAKYTLEEIDDELLARYNLQAALSLVKNYDTFTAKQRRDLAALLEDLFKRALPYFEQGAKSNPMSHNTQALNNMVKIAIGEEFSYRKFTVACIAALLHDVGNAFCTKRKVTPAEIYRELSAGNIDKVKALVEEVNAYRIEHMEKGAELLEIFLKPLIEADIISAKDVTDICSVVRVHDYPYIERFLRDLYEHRAAVDYVPGAYLFRFGESQASWLMEALRDADRLYMMTYQGVVKDLIFDNQPVTPENIMRQLQINIKIHIDEFVLYQEAAMDDGGFMAHTSYRTPTAYHIFKSATTDTEQAILKSSGDFANPPKSILAAGICYPSELLCIGINAAA